MPEEQWLRTPHAAIACGVSERTLKRLRGDVLEEGIHYQVGFSSRIAIVEDATSQVFEVLDSTMTR